MCEEMMVTSVLSDVPKMYLRELRAGGTKGWRSIIASKTAWGTMDTLYRNDIRACLNKYKKMGIINFISQLTKCAGTRAVAG